MVFKPGQSGNPSGRARKSNKAAGMAREYTEASIKTLVQNLTSDKGEIQIKAAVELLNRGWGKPQEYIELSNDPENPVTDIDLAAAILKKLSPEVLEQIVNEANKPTEPQNYH